MIASLLLENNFIINIILLISTLFFGLKNYSAQNLFYAFITYIVFHNIYAFLIFFHPEGRVLYILFHTTGQPSIYTSIWGKDFFLNNNYIRYACILTWILVINFCLLIDKKIKIKQILLNHTFVFLLFILWFILTLYNVFSISEYYNYKFFLTKLLAINVFFSTYFFLKFNIMHSLSVVKWTNFIPFTYVLNFAVATLTIFEFAIMNSQLSTNIKCISFADMTCVLRSTGSMFNPNTLGFYFVIMNIIFTAIIIIKEKIKFIPIFMIMLSLLCIFLSGSRSSLFFLSLFQLMFLFLILIYSKNHLVRAIKYNVIWFGSFFTICIVNNFNLLSNNLNNAIELLFVRFSSMPFILYNFLIKMLNATTLFFYLMLNRVISGYETIKISILQNFTFIKQSTDIRENDIFVNPPNFEKLNVHSSHDISSAQYQDRMNSYSTDNTYIVLLRDEEITSLWAFIAILLYFFFRSFELFIKTKNIIYAVNTSVIFSLSIALSTLNLFANFPIYFFVSIFLATILILNESEIKNFSRI